MKLQPDSKLHKLLIEALNYPDTQSINTTLRICRWYATSFRGIAVDAISREVFRKLQYTEDSETGLDSIVAVNSKGEETLIGIIDWYLSSSTCPEAMS